MPSAPLRSRPFVVYEQDIVDERRLIAALYEWLIDVYPLPPRAALDEGFKLKVEEGETLHEVLGSALLAHLLPDENLRETQAMQHPALDVELLMVLLNERRLGARLFEARWGAAPRYWTGSGLWQCVEPKLHRVAQLAGHDYLLVSRRSRIDVMLTWTPLSSTLSPRAIITADDDLQRALEVWASDLSVGADWPAARWLNDVLKVERQALSLE
jgi:hypothetical protein